ncbi:MBG domain-containing protein [Pedobacter gandavensis]|uniref:T9SS type B sorting domain-containing protein n=1 Tax=Pedobacter gandavensis TaxID=2679963 RepID=A0ABR6EXD8_9SPHI|nr:MBG domain-containing protein [Pedobacter gandavensis]MBB2149931.1 T9SS type B sorting domain-containing protein [Pedobacter gandavensis]
MKTSYLQKVTLFIIFCLFCFSAKTSNAQLVAGDLAIIGVNAEPTVTATPRATISFVALTEIPSGTVVHLTDIGYTGSAFVLAPVPPGTTSPDGTANWTVSTKVPAGTVFTVTIKSGVSPTVSILPGNYGTINLDAISWSHEVAAPIPLNAGDTWFLYTGTKTSPDFIYGFTNAKNPDLDEIDESTGWTKDGKTPKNQSSTLPTALKTAGAYTSLNSYKTVDKQRDFNAYAGSFTGSKSSLLDLIKTPTAWTTTDNTAEVKDLTPGATGGAFPGTQPIYKLASSVLSVTSNPSTGTKGLNAAIVITVNFSENVYVTNSPRIKLNSGINAYANYTSGSNSKALTFTYTVADGDSSDDLDYSTINSLELNGGSITDLQSQNAQLSLPLPGSAESLGGSSNLKIDALKPTISTVTAVTPNGSYSATQNISIQVNFTEPVAVIGAPVLSLNTLGTATYASGTGTNSLTFTYAVLPGQNTSDLDYASTTALAATGGSIKDAAGNDATLTLPAPGAAGSLGANANIIIDTTFPTITGVSGTNGTYNIGTTAPIRVTFSENVTVTGTPQLSLSVVGPAATASYTSGSGTSILTFNYTVLAGQANPDLDYSATNSLSLNSGSINDAAGNIATLTLPTPNNSGSLAWNSDLNINGIRPTVASIVRTAGAPALTKSTSVNYTVTFSEAVSGVDLGDFVITSSGTLIAPGISSVTGSGTTYTLTVSTGTTNGTGTLRLDLNNSGTGIVGASGNAIAAGYTSGESYSVDRTLPTLSSVSIASNNSNTQIARNGDIVTLTFTADEAINPPSVTINSTPVTATNTSGFSYTASYPVSMADPEGQITFSINFTDLVGNVAPQRTTTTNATKVAVDNIPTTITSVSTTAGNGPHGIGVTLPITVTFSEPVTVTGTPRIALNSGGNATYSGGTGSAILNFNYTVASSQNTAQLDYTSSTALTLTGGATINDQNDISAPLTLPAPGGTGSLADGKTIVINGFTPTVLSIIRKTPATQMTNANSVEYTLTFSEPVSGVDVSDFQMSLGSTPVSSVNGVVGSGAIYTVTVNTGVGNGTVAFNLRTSGTGIANLASNPILTGFGPSESYTIDKILPTIPTASIRSSRFGNSSIAIPGETITLFFSASETINAPTVTISGNPATVTNPTGNNWVATYTMLATDNNGAIPFSISYSDLAGNTGTSRTTTTDATVVTFDKTVPTLSPVTIASNNISYPAYAKVGDLLTLTFTASESIPSPTVTIGAATVTALPAGGFNWMAMYAIPTTMAEGEIPFSISFKDTFGNIGIPVTTVSTGSMVTLDKTTPTLSNVSISSNNPNSALTKAGDVISLTFASSEAVNTPIVTFFGSKTATVSSVGNNLWRATYAAGPTDPEGIVAFNITYSDLAGNSGTAVSTTDNATSVTYDRTPPVTPNFLAVVPGDMQNTLAWAMNPDVAKYELIGGAPIGLGNNVLTTFTAANVSNPMSFTQTGLTNFTTYYYALVVTDAAGNTNQSITVNAKPLNGQTITFNQPAAAEYGSTFTLNANSSSGLPVTFTSNDLSVATISGNTVTIVGADPSQSVSISANQPGNANYFAAPELTLSLQITPKPVTVTATAQSKVFNDPEPALAAPTITPALIGTDVSTGALARETGENTGTYEIQQNTFSLDPYKYAITYEPANFSISKKAVTITAVSNSKTYGDADPVFAYTGTPALVSGDQFTGLLGRVSGEDVGNYALTLGSLKVSENYTLTLNPGTQLSINKKSILVTADAQSKVYGTADPVFSYTPTPALLNGNVFNGTLGRAPGENKGTYATTPGNLSAGSNYDLSFTAANLTINPAPLTLTADPKSKFVGTANPVFTGQYAGFVNGEDTSVLTSPAVYTSVATIASPIGTYPIVPSGATALNYTITPVNGVLTVKPGAPTAVALAAITLYENQASGTPAGTLSSTSEDPNATFTYSLVGGSGDTDNAAFRIVNDQLVTAASLDYENKKTYSVVVRSTTQHGFSLDKSFSINLSDVNEIPTLDAIANKTICYTTTGQTIDLTGISAGPELGQNTKITVTGSNDALLQSLTVAQSGSAKGTISYRIKNGASGLSTITVTVKDDGGIDNGGVDTYSRTFVLTVNALPVVAISANTGENNNANSTSVSKGETVILTASGGSNYVWALHNSVISGQNSGILTVRPRETTTYTVTVSNANGCSEQKSFTVNVLDDMEKIKATNILSPNGDGYNDKWIIENIDFYPNNEVKIFDRSGRMVYSKKSYDNSWDGTLNGMPLSEGTYYYVIDFGKNHRIIKGFITIIREN